MAKKRVVFTMLNMGIGGVERALIGLLNTIDYQKYDVDIFMNNRQGEFLSLIPSSVTLLPEIEQYAMFTYSSVSLIKKGYWKIAIVRKYPRLLSWFLARRLPKGISNNSLKHYQMKYLMPLLPDINPEVEYDLAVGFIQPFHVAAHKIRAKRKIAWLHGDFTNQGLDVKGELALWGHLDNFVSISEKVTEGFLARFPSMADKVVRIDHLISKDFIVAQSLLDDVSMKMTGEVRLCTVARLSPEKNIIAAVKMCSIIVAHNPNTYWYIVGGEGGNADYVANLKTEIVRLGMQHHFILLGAQTNPYPYIAHCHIYIQPSLHEAKSIAVIEAQMLGKPTIITNYNTSQSQLRDGVDGVIVPMQPQEAAQAIIDVIENRELRQTLHENCKSTNYSNASEIEKFYALIP